MDLAGGLPSSLTDLSSLASRGPSTCSMHLGVSGLPNDDAVILH